MATSQQLKAMRKKYHLGEYRNSNQKTKSKQRGKMAKRRKSYRRSSGGKDNVMGKIVGVAGALAYETYLSPKIPVEQPMKNIGEAVAGYYLSRQKGFVGQIGKAIFYYNLFLVGQSVMPTLNIS